MYGSVSPLSPRGLTTGSSKKYEYKKLDLSCFILDPVVKRRDDRISCFMLHLYHRLYTYHFKTTSYNFLYGTCKSKTC
nr:palindromic element RPE4 domain-containing protein [Rickettsia asembonensis]